MVLKSDSQIKKKNCRTPFVLDDDSDKDNIQDFMMYNSKYKGSLVLDSFYDSEVELNDKEELILEGMMDSTMSIFELYDIDSDSDKCRIYLKDLLKPGSYEVINLGFSQSGVVGYIFCTRLIKIDKGIYMTSGSTFLFDSDKKDRLLADYSFEKLKQRRNLTSEELFILCNKKSKLYGKRVKHLDLSGNGESF